MANEEKAHKGTLPCKIVLIGENAVYKPIIASRYASNTFSSVIASTPIIKTAFFSEQNQLI